MSIDEQDLSDLARAKQLLENPGLAAKAMNMIGVPFEKGFESLPEKYQTKIGEITRSALTKAVDTAVLTMDSAPSEEASNVLHKFVVAATGAIGGFFGLSALAVELPISTTVMLRSIADIARSEGHDVSDLETKAACIEVFALGGPSKSDDASESGYYAVRMALGRAVSQAAEHAAGKGASRLVQLIIMVAERFSIQISEKAAVQAAPAIGAAGGAVINTVFIDHFQNMARGHFIVRRLEFKYGQDYIKNAYYGI